MSVTVNTPIFSLGPPYCTLDWFKKILFNHGSPALADAADIYAALNNAGFNLEIALGQFAAESAYGTKGYAVTTKSWGNQLYAAWLSSHATPYSPGNGYTYAKFASWLDSVVYGYLPLLTAYKNAGYSTLGTMAAHWLGATVGDARWTSYTNNIIAAAAANAPSSGVVEVNAVTQEPGLLCDCTPGATVYYDEAKTKIAIPTWGGANNVGLYSMPYQPTGPDGKASMAAVRLGLGAAPYTPTLCYIGIDHVTNVRGGDLVPPCPPVDCTQQVADAVAAQKAADDAACTTSTAEAVAAQKAADDAACATSTQAAIDATKASAKVAVVFE